MRWQMPDEDAYWEGVREDMEKSSKGTGDFLQESLLSLDDVIEDLEEEYGCRIEELYEGDLCEIVRKFRGIAPEDARWDDRLDCIVYRYYKAVG